MRTSTVAATTTAVIATLIVSLAWAAGRTAPSGPVPPPAEGAVTVIELFTSQGCSSCPPADRVLTELGADPAYSGRVVPLAFHVDYWNQLGWADPLSSEDASERQRAYAGAFGTSRIYTPQLVVGGRTECVGSNESAARELIARALGEKPLGTIELALSASAGGVEIEAKATLATGAPRAVLLLAVVESGLVTPIGRGENARRTLANDHVVRRLERLGTVEPGEEASRRTRRIPFDSSWQTGKLSLVAFLQDPESLVILGATTRPLSR